MPLTRKVLRFPLTRIAIWIGIVGICYWLTGTLLPTSRYGYWLLSLSAAGALILVGTLVEGRSLAETGFGPKGALKDLAGGFLFAALLMSATIGVMAAAGWYQITGVQAFSSLTAWVLVYYFFVGLLEEVAMRGVLFRISEEWLGSWGALLLNSLVFGLLHLGNRNATLLAALAIAVEAGLLLTAAYLLTRSLWLAIGLHWGWNFVQGTVFGAPVSGGSGGHSLLKATFSGPEWATGGAFGPEAGLICLVVGTLAGAWLLVQARRKGHLLAPAWRRRAGEVPGRG